MNDEDKKLVELAAKVNGLQVKGWIGERLSFFDPILDSAEYEWNPLNDDADAFRLAAKARLRIDFYDDQVEVKDGCDLYLIGKEEFENTFVRIEPYEHHGNIPSAARRAIVRAAAYIGEHMK